MQSLMNNPVTRSNAPCLIVGIGYTTGSVPPTTRRRLETTPQQTNGGSSDRQTASPTLSTAN